MSLFLSIFVLHAQQHPIEVLAHLAATTTALRDSFNIDAAQITDRATLERLHHQSIARITAAQIQVLIEAGDSYTPSGEASRKIVEDSMAKFPHGTMYFPLDVVTDYR